MEIYDDSPIADSDAEDEESGNEIDNVSVIIISSDESDDNVQPISYLSMFPVRINTGKVIR